MFSEWNVLIFELAPSDILRIFEQAFLQKMIEKVSGELLTEERRVVVVKRVVNRKSKVTEDRGRNKREAENTKRRKVGPSKTNRKR